MFEKSLLYLMINCLLYAQASYRELEDADKDPARQTDHHQNYDQILSGGRLFEDFAHVPTADESKLRLALLVDEKIDTNKDELVQLDELVNWLRKRQEKYAQDDANRHWVAYQTLLDGSQTLGWDDYTNKEYDHLVTLTTKQSIDLSQLNRLKESHNYHLERDKRRWKAADIDQDGRLSLNEFKLFLHPRESAVMQHLVFDEKFELLDRNHDGKISADEYLVDLTPNEIHVNPTKDQQDEWLREERSKFYKVLDRDGDKHLNKEEYSQLIGEFGEIDEQIVAEAKHLLQSADTNRDHRLNKEEILQAYHEFVNSHATDFGEALRSHQPFGGSHDEL